MYVHFKAVNDAIGIPIIIYNIPPRSVVDMSVDTMKRLFELKNIAGVKDATGNLARVSTQREAMGPDFIQLSGEDMTALAYNAAGGHGCISVVSNVAPALCAKLQDATPGGRLSGSDEDPGSPDPAACTRSSSSRARRREMRPDVARPRQRGGPAAAAAGDAADQGCDPQRHGACRAVELMAREASKEARARPSEDRRRQPQGALQLRDRRDLRGRRRADRQRGEIAARRQGDDRANPMPMRATARSGWSIPTSRNICRPAASITRRSGRANCCCTSARSTS